MQKMTMTTLLESGRLGNTQYYFTHVCN